MDCSRTSNVKFGMPRPRSLRNSRSPGASATASRRLSGGVEAAASSTPDVDKFDPNVVHTMKRAKGSYRYAGPIKKEDAEKMDEKALAEKWSASGFRKPKKVDRSNRLDDAAIKALLEEEGAEFTPSESGDSSSMASSGESSGELSEGSHYRAARTSRPTSSRRTAQPLRKRVRRSGSHSGNSLVASQSSRVREVAKTSHASGSKPKKASRSLLSREVVVDSEDPIEDEQGKWNEALRKAKPLSRQGLKELVAGKAESKPKPNPVHKNTSAPRASNSRAALPASVPDAVGRRGSKSIVGQSTRSRTTGIAVSSIEQARKKALQATLFSEEYSSQFVEQSRLFLSNPSKAAAATLLKLRPVPEIDTTGSPLSNSGLVLESASSLRGQRSPFQKSSSAPPQANPIPPRAAKSPVLPRTSPKSPRRTTPVPGMANVLETTEKDYTPVVSTSPFQLPKGTSRPRRSKTPKTYVDADVQTDSRLGSPGARRKSKTPPAPVVLPSINTLLPPDNPELPVQGSELLLNTPVSQAMLSASPLGLHRSANSQTLFHQPSAPAPRLPQYAPRATNSTEAREAYQANILRASRARTLTDELIDAVPELEGSPYSEALRQSKAVQLSIILDNDHLMRELYGNHPGLALPDVGFDDEQFIQARLQRGPSPPSENAPGGGREYNALKALSDSRRR